MSHLPPITGNQTIDAIFYGIFALLLTLAFFGAHSGGGY